MQGYLKLGVSRQETGTPFPEPPVPPVPVPVPGPDLPAPIPVPLPDPDPPSPWPEPDDSGRAVVPLPVKTANIEIVLHGSTAIVTGVVRELEVWRCILDALSSLASITTVEDHLRVPAA